MRLSAECEKGNLAGVLRKAEKVDNDHWEKPWPVEELSLLESCCLSTVGYNKKEIWSCPFVAGTENLEPLGFVIPNGTVSITPGFPLWYQYF